MDNQDSEKVDDVAGDSDTAVAERMELQVTVTQPSACQRHVTVSIPREDLNRYFQDAVEKMVPDATVPGFRAGRAPRKVVENHFRKEIKDQVKGKVLLDAMTQVSEDQKFSAISEPDFDFMAVNLPDTGPMSFEFDVEVRPEFTLPQWRGLTIERPEREFGREDIDRQVARILERIGQMSSVDQPARRDDYLMTDITVLHDGREVTSQSDVELRVRPELDFPDAHLEGFESIAEGALPGSELVVKVTLSENAEDPALRGETVEVRIKVREILRMELPPLDSETLRRLGDFENEGELRDRVLAELRRQLRYHQDRVVRKQITELLTESADWDLPPSLLERQSDRELERATMELQASGFAEDQIVKYLNAIRRNSRANTALALKEHFILERIAEDEKIDAEESDFDQEILLIASQTHDSPRAVRARIEKRNSIDVLRNQIIERKVLDRIIAAAKIRPVPFEFSADRQAVVATPLVGAPSAAIPEAKHDDNSLEKAKTPGSSEFST